MKMLNKEKFAKEILDIVCNGNRFGVINGKPIVCEKNNCHKCKFNRCFKCAEAIKEWANSEYIELPVNWSKIPVDTPILVKEFKEDEWHRRYFARYKDGRIYAWDNGRTSWNANEFKVPWIYAELAKNEGHCI